MRVAPAFVLSAALVLTGCSGGSATPAVKDGVVQVVAIEGMWGDVARQIGGGHAKVTSIVTDPTADPHTFETDPATAAVVGSSTFVIKNGAGYDDFADKLLVASPRQGRVVLDVGDLVGAEAGKANPHLWYSPAFVTRTATEIAARLAALAPASKAAFDAGLATFLAGYQSYVDELATIKSRYPGASVAYTERVPGYLVDQAGLILASPAGFAQAVEDGTDPSPADVQAFDAALTGHKVRVLLVNGQVSSPVTAKVEKLARDSGVPVVRVTETLPAGQTFQAWQLAQAQSVASALAP
jgi:zinc/manganese transport system substrate-binding protein